MVPVVPVPLIKRKMIIRRFLRAGATDAIHAVNPSDIHVHKRFLFSRLVSNGILVEAGDSRYYVDTTNI